MTLGKPGKQTNYDYEITPTGKVVQSLSNVNFVLVGFTKDAEPIYPVEISRIDYTLNDLFENKELVIGTYPIMKVHKRIYVLALPVTGTADRINESRACLPLSGPGLPQLRKA